MSVSPGRSSPWGRIQTVRAVADGIYKVTTAGHGGLKLDRERNERIPKGVRQSGGWYEEDCEWSIVACRFPEFFPVAVQGPAIKTCKDYFPAAFEEITGVAVDPSESRALREVIFREANKDNFVVVAASGDWSEGCPVGFVVAKASVGGRDENGHHGPTIDFLVPQDEYRARPEFGFVIDLGRHQRVRAQ